MLTIGDISAKIDKVLIDEMSTTMINIGNNLQRNDQFATGNTEDSLRVDAKDMKGTIYGAAHFDTLEEGISPQRSKSESFLYKYRGIFMWSQAKGLMWTKRRAFVTAEMQEEYGSKLFRDGGRTDVWTSEEQPLMESLKERVAELLINEKWLE